MRNKILKCIGNNKVTITYFLLEKEDITFKILKRHQMKNFSFTILITETVGKSPVNIIIDKYLFKDSIKEFNDALHQFNPNVKFSVNHLDSRENRGIQVADFVAGAIHTKYRDNNSPFYELISHKIQYNFNFKDHGRIILENKNIKEVN